MSELPKSNQSCPSISDINRSAILIAISETLSRYCYAVDEKDRNMLLDTFTDFIISHRADIRRHFLTNLWISKIDGDIVIVESYHLIVVSDSGKSETRCTGTYRDEMVLSNDGVWRSRFKDVKLDAAY